MGNGERGATGGERTETDGERAAANGKSAATDGQRTATDGERTATSEERREKVGNGSATGERRALHHGEPGTSRRRRSVGAWEVILAFSTRACLAFSSVLCSCGSAVPTGCMGDREREGFSPGRHQPGEERGARKREHPSEEKGAINSLLQDMASRKRRGLGSTETEYPNNYVGRISAIL